MSIHVPDWYWPWVRWRLGEGEFKGDPRNPARRPANVPPKIEPWAYDKLAAFLRKRLTAALVVAPPELLFWRHMGMWITRIDHFPVSYVAEYGRGEYPNVIVPCLYGTVPERNTAGLREYVQALQAIGCKVSGSQWGQPADADAALVEADEAVRKIKEIGFDGWVLNGEKAYEGGGKSLAYVLRFRAHLPHFPLGWSPEVRLSLDHSYLIKNNVAYMPQAYPLEAPAATLTYAVEWAHNFGYDLKNVIPLIQAYETNGVRKPAAEYRDEAKSLGLENLILYTANQCADVPQYFRDLVVR